MANIIDHEEVLNELAVLKKQLADIKNTGGPRSGSSEWKVSAEWKNKSKEFPGEYRIDSQLTLPEKFDAIEHIQRLSNDVSSSKLVEVAKSLKEAVTK
jgi:hypothetical protein